MEINQNHDKVEKVLNDVIRRWLCAAFVHIHITSIYQKHGMQSKWELTLTQHWHRKKGVNIYYILHKYWEHVMILQILHLVLHAKQKKTTNKLDTIIFKSLMKNKYYYLSYLPTTLSLSKIRNSLLFEEYFVKTAFSVI